MLTVFLHFGLQTLGRMHLARDGSSLKSGLQALLYMYFLLPHCAGYVTQPGTDQYESRVTIREIRHHTGAMANLPFQPLNQMIGADADSVFAGKIAVGQCFL